MPKEYGNPDVGYYGKRRDNHAEEWTVVVQVAVFVGVVDVEV
jgi:hypothetical protein